MAIAKTSHQILFDGTAADKSVSSGGNATSEIQAIAGNAVAGALEVRVNNDGTPAAWDIVTVKILYTLGDPDADPESSGGYEYATVEHATPIEIDTDLENPVISQPIPIDVTALAFKVYIDNAGASACTCSAQYVEQTA